MVIHPRFIAQLNFDNLFRIVSKFFKNNDDDDVKHFLNLLMEKIDLLLSIFSGLEYCKLPVFGQIWFVVLLILVIMAKKRVNIQSFTFNIMYNDIKRFLNNNEEEGDDGMVYYCVGYLDQISRRDIMWLTE